MPLEQLQGNLNFNWVLYALLGLFRHPSTATRTFTGRKPQLRGTAEAHYETSLWTEGKRLRYRTARERKVT